MVNEEIVGTDIDKDWTLDAESDLSLVKGSDNLSQAIFLRLTAYFESMNWVYDLYGSYVKDWLGKNQNPYTRNTLVAEIRKRIFYDPRVSDAEVELVDWYSNSLGVKITAEIADGTSFQEYFIFSDIPRRNDNINSPQWKNTWIDTNENGYYGKQGEFVTVKCYVRDSDNRKIVTGIKELDDPRVPIGQVSLSIGGYHVDIEQNPQEIAQSGSKDPGSCTFTFRIPKFIKKGTHKLTFTFKGIRGYNNSVGSTNLYVVDRLPTSMEFIYPEEGRDWYYVNNHGYFKEPIVHVKDANNYDVLHGQVRYYLSNYKGDGLIFIEFPIIFHGSTLLQKTVHIYCDESLLDYSDKFIFKVAYMFRPFDIIEIVGKNGEHIDYLQVHYENKIYYLTSTQYTKPFESTDEEGNPTDTSRNHDIDTMRKSSSPIRMEVIE